MSETNFNTSEHSDPKGVYKTFVRQMSKWYNGGELPEVAGQNLQFVLELQKQKLQSLGLDMKSKLKKAGAGQNNTGSLSFSDRIFTNYIVSGNTSMTRSVVSTQDNSIYILPTSI